MLGSMLAGVTAGLAVAVPLGAIGVMIVELGARAGFGAGFRAGLGTALCDGGYAAVAALAGAGVAHALGGAQRAITLAAAAALAALGAWLVLSARRFARAGDAAPPAPRHLTLRFLALTAINPLTAAVFAGLIAGDPDLAPGAAAAALFVGGAFAASLAWQSTLAAAGAVLHHRLPSRAAPWTRAASGLLVVVLAVHTALSA